MKRHAWLFAFTLLLALPAAAQASRAYADVTLNMRAGPDIGYPIVDIVQSGTPVYVHGCTSGWAWCDITAYGHRGWVAGDFLRYTYRDRWVSVYGYGAVIGIPVIRFVIGDYWPRYYRHRTFYHNRDYWYHRHVRRHYVPRHHRWNDRYERHHRTYRAPERRHAENRHQERRYQERRHEEHRQREHRRIERHDSDRRHEQKRRLAPTVLHRSAPTQSSSRSHDRRQQVPDRRQMQARAPSHRAPAQSSQRSHNERRGKDSRHHGKHDRDRR